MTNEGKVGVTAIVVVLWTAISCVACPQLATRYRLRSRASVTEGQVIKVDAHDHNRATYRYTVGNAGFEGSEIMSHRHAGDRVRVYFDPSDPRVGMLVEPGERLGDDLLGLMALYAFSGGAVLWIGARADRARSS